MTPKIEFKAVGVGLAVSVVGPFLVGFVLSFCVSFIAAILGTSVRGSPFFSGSALPVELLVISGIASFVAGVIAGKLASQSLIVQGVAVGLLTTLCLIAIPSLGLRAPGSGLGAPGSSLAQNSRSGLLLLLYPLWLGAPVLGAKVVAMRRVRRASSSGAV